LKISFNSSGLKAFVFSAVVKADAQRLKIGDIKGLNGDRS
jgi:hypothetical protein